MKVKIGNYKNWFGAYQLAEKLCFWTKSRDKYGLPEYPDWVHDFGSWLADTWIHSVLQWIDSKRKRTVEVHIDKWDTWSMDGTLALIIVPMLKQLRDTTHGYPANFTYEDQAYGPQGYFEGEGWEFPEDGFEQWKATLDKMIWAFEQVIDDDWEAQYRTGECDFEFKECDDYFDENGQPYYEMVDGPNHTLVTDYDGIAAHRERMQEGFDLFAKYYTGLWD